VPAALRAFGRCSAAERLCVVIIGAGSSALATALFTEAFKLSATSGDFISPVVLQKLQPVFAVLLAVLLLRERIRPAFGLFALPALGGAWLLAFADPVHVTVRAVQVALCAVAAAALWAAGTVLGRRVSRSVRPQDLTVLRYCFGLPAAALITAQQHSAYLPGRGNLFGLVLLALIPGLAALGLYYVGLRATAAARATFAELAFPATAAVIGVAFLGSRLTGTQWLGFGIVVAAVSALSLRERRPDPLVVEPPDPRSPGAAPAAGAAGR
jgi:drug/metabolite transporter (DMT)-like permease